MQKDTSPCASKSTSNKPPPDQPEPDQVPDIEDPGSPYLSIAIGRWLGRITSRYIVKHRRPFRLSETERISIAITLFFFWAALLYAYFGTDPPFFNWKEMTLMMVMLASPTWMLIKYYWRRFQGRRRKS